MNKLKSYDMIWNKVDKGKQCEIEQIILLIKVEQINDSLLLTL